MESQRKLEQKFLELRIGSSEIEAAAYRRRSC